jgi:hypothetical protein
MQVRQVQEVGSVVGSTRPLKESVDSDNGDDVEAR